MFLVSTDVFLWDVNSAAELTPFERFRFCVRSLCSACVKDTRWSSSSGLYASSSATIVIPLCSESELYSMLPSGSGTGRSRPWGIGLMVKRTSGYWKWCLFLWFIPSEFRIFSSSSRPFEWQMASSSFYYSSNPSSSPCFTANIGENGLSWFSILTPKLSGCAFFTKSVIFASVRKNHITADQTKPVRIILTLVIHSYRNTNVKLKREKNKSILSSSLFLDTVH